MKRTFFTKAIFALLLLCGGAAKGQIAYSNLFTSYIATNSYKDTTETPQYKHSVGVSAFCSFVGVSFKFNLKNNLYLQTDFGGDAYLDFLFIPISPALGADFGTQIYIIYEDKFPKRTNVFWIAGFGLNFAGVPHIPYSKQVSLKGGVKTILGIECAFGKSPLSLQVDTRWGYGIIHSTKGVKPWERNGYIPDDKTYHFLDYGIVFSLRYHFGKKRTEKVVKN